MGYVLDKYTKQLKPCPFCGEDNHMSGMGAVYMQHDEERHKVRVQCSSCGVVMVRDIRPDKDTAQLLVEAWNRRDA